MGAEFLKLVADVFVDVLEGEEESGSDGGGAGAGLDTVAKVLLAGVHEAAIGVVDDHEFLGAEKIVGDEERAEGIVGDDTTGVADDMSVAGFQAESADGEARVHAGKNGEFAFGARGEAAEFVSLRVNFVCGEDFVDDRHEG